MSRLFAYDAPLSRALNLVGDLILLNLLWLLFSLPLFTMGAATAALYASADRRSSAPRPAAAFCAAFRACFRQATLLWAPLLLWGGVLAANLIFIPTLEGTPKSVLLGLTLVLCLLFLSLISYLFPLLALRPAPAATLLGRALVLSMRHPLRTLAILTANLFPALLFLLSPGWFFRLIFVWPLIGAAAIAYGNLFHFRSLIPREG